MYSTVPKNSDAKRKQSNRSVVGKEKGRAESLFEQMIVHQGLSSSSRESIDASIRNALNDQSTRDRTKEGPNPKAVGKSHTHQTDSVRVLINR